MTKVNILKILIFAFFISGIIFFFYSNGMFFGWQMGLLDKLFLSRAVNPKIFVIKIDDKSINKLGRWPWDRKIHAEIIDKICREQPAVIGIDVNFSEPSNAQSDQKLAESIKKCPMVLPLLAEISLAGKKNIIDSLTFPIPELGKTPNLGVANLPLDQDGVFRKAFFKLSDRAGTQYYSFAAAIAEKYDPGSLSNISLDQQGRMLVNFSGPPGRYNSISASDFLSSEKGFSLAGKIILLGATAPDLHDNYLVPTSNGIAMNGVEIHANIIDTIIGNNFLRPVNAYLQMTIFALLILITSFIMFRFSLIRGTIFILILLLAYVLSALVLIEKLYVLDLLYPLLSVLLTYITIIIYRNLTDVREKRRIRKAFACYVSPEVIEEILKNPEGLKLGGENKNLSILFSDIRGFTSISEKLSAHSLISFLNDYLSLMSDLIMQENGVVDKYIGDAIMAFWGAPILSDKHATDSCRVALSMIKKLEENIPRWEETYNFTPNIGIGINTGEVIVGNVGSDKRFDYTVMGDSVNLASRLESLTKKYKVRIIVSQFTKEAAGSDFVFRHLDKVVVKGKKEGVDIFELIGLAEEINQEEKNLIEKFSEGVRNYQAQNWTKAGKMFEAVKREKEENELVNMYLERIREMKKNPPGKEWDGSTVLTEK